MKLINNIANIITSARIFCGIALMFCRALSPIFYVLYIIAGISDMIDGTVARKTNTASQFGSKFDTIADGVFILVCMIKLFPIFDIYMWIYIAVAIIAIIKAVNIVLGYSVHKRFVCVHSTVNKVTGLLLFGLPLTFNFIDLKYSAGFVCIVALFAAIWEGYDIREIIKWGDIYE